MALAAGMRQNLYGWLMRYLHANGRRLFYIVLYMHLFRSSCVINSSELHARHTRRASCVLRQHAPGTD